MARCNYCGAETRLFDNGSPICLKCAAEHEATHQQTEAEKNLDEMLARYATSGSRSASE